MSAMFEDVTERLSPTTEKSIIRIKFVKNKDDVGPRLIVILTKAFLETFQLHENSPCSLGLGREADTGKIRIGLGCGAPVGKMRFMKLGGVLIDYGAIKDAQQLWGVGRAVPPKEAKVLTTSGDTKARDLIVEMPIWEAHETVKPRGHRKKKDVTQEEKPVPAPQAPAKTGTAAMTSKPLVSVMPPGIVFKGKRVSVTEFQAVLIGAMANNFQELATASQIISNGYKAAGREPPHDAEMNLPQALQGAQGTLRLLGLQIVHVKGQGWGLDVL